jgi:hypothetical protein
MSREDHHSQSRGQAAGNTRPAARPMSNASLSGAESDSAQNKRALDKAARDARQAARDSRAYFPTCMPDRPPSRVMTHLQEDRPQQVDVNRSNLESQTPISDDVWLATPPEGQNVIQELSEILVASEGHPAPEHLGTASIHSDADTLVVRLAGAHLLAHTPELP